MCTLLCTDLACGGILEGFGKRLRAVATGTCSARVCPCRSSVRAPCVRACLHSLSLPHSSPLHPPPSLPLPSQFPPASSVLPPLFKLQFSTPLASALTKRRTQEKKREKLCLRCTQYLPVSLARDPPPPRVVCDCFLSALNKVLSGGHFIVVERKPIVLEKKLHCC